MVTLLYTDQKQAYTVMALLPQLEGVETGARNKELTDYFEGGASK